MAKHNRPRHRRMRWRLVTRLMARDGTNCTICSEPLDRHIHDCHAPMYVTFDHIVPRSHGGLTTYKNLRLAHSRCNSARGNDPITDDDAIGAAA